MFANQLVPRVARDAFGRKVDVEEKAIGVGDKDRVGGVLNVAAEAFLTFADFVLGDFAFSDIGDDGAELVGGDLQGGSSEVLPEVGGVVFEGHRPASAPHLAEGFQPVGLRAGQDLQTSSWVSSRAAASREEQPGGGAPLARRWLG